jgi:16S rRNA (adenine1518-N6/adenine1519-N6)-dimethyltransferase
MAEQQQAARIRLAVDALPSLPETLRKHQIRTKKSLGQHFLFDQNITDKIVLAAGNISSATVMEIGPGPGGLTRSLLRAGVGRLIAVERDDACLPLLRELEQLSEGRLTILGADALQQDDEAMLRDAGVPPGDVRIIANLPYNIGTELLCKWVEHAPLFSQMVLMFQKEVAERVVAAPGSGDYGRLAVLCQWLYEGEMLFDLPPGAFTPPPKVTSSVIRLTRRKEPLAPANRATLQKLLLAVFSQRRKMLRGSLRQIHPDPEALLRQTGIDPTLRPESLDISSFCALARALDGMA